MKRMLVIAIALAAAGGCKKKEPPPASTGSGAGQPAQPAPPMARPSQQPNLLPQMPEMQLAEDAKRTEKIELGHNLFFDKRLSGPKDRSCYSCHQNEDGLGGHDPIAIGADGKPVGRHAPHLWNVGYYQNAFYWDGRAATLEDNAKAAWAGANMGGGKDNLDKIAADLYKVAGYKKLFDAAFPGTPIKGEHIAAALAEYMRTFICKDTAYDKYAAGDKTALSEEQQRGLDVFLGKGQCSVCHAPPFFSTAMATPGGVYFNVGIGTQGVPEDQVDIGRMKVTQKPEDWAAFKPPSLRNVPKTPPYFHDGSAPKLEDAVKIMSTGGLPNKNKTALLADRALTDAERGDLIKFLGGLECGGKLEAPAKMP
jgi:cytochrome c peroxidase